MKNIIHQKQTLLCRAVMLFAAALALAGCAKDEIVSGPGNGGADRTLVQFSIMVPANSAPATRSIDEDQEMAVTTVDILAFDGDDLLYHKSVSGITANTFSVELPLSEKSLKFMFLANAKKIIEAHYPSGEIPAATKYADVQKTLVASSDVKWNAIATNNYDPLPMWGEKSFQVAENTSEESVELVRMLARINVYSKATDFVLEKVFLYNPMTQGYLVPDSDNRDNTGGFTTPTLHDSWSRKAGRFEYDADNNQCKNEIYTFEALAGNRDACTFLVIAGKYDGGETTYYRLDFTDESGKYLDLLRNHKYEFTIKSVGMEGYATEKAAVDAGPVNIYKLTVEDEFDLRHYIWDDQYFLGIEKENINVVSWLNYTINFKLKTDFPDGWTAEIDDNCKSWLKFENDDYIISQPNTVKTLPIVISEHDIGSTTGYIYITAGRLSLTIEIETEPRSVPELFAKSNVVMNLDGSLGFATTAAENDEYPANQQGLFFKWGSLVGISVTDGTDEFSPENVVFSPVGYAKPTEWDSIPYHKATKSTYPTDDDDFKDIDGGKGFDVANGIGDICRYISDQGWIQGKWRMPTAAEYQALWNSRDTGVSKATGTWSAPSVIGNYYGTTQFSMGWWIGNAATTSITNPPESTLFFPAGGNRNGNARLVNYGREGYGWSASASTDNYGNILYIYSSGVGSARSYIRSNSFPVRCIRDYENDY